MELSIKPKVMTVTPTPVSAGVSIAAKLDTESASDIQFSGRYVPKEKKLRDLAKALQGWPDTDSITGPDYFAPVEQADALYDFLKTGTALTPALKASFSDRKASVINHFADINHDVEIQPESLRDDVDAFLEDFYGQVTQCTDDLKTYFNFNDSEIDAFRRFATVTAPLLFNLGFADAIPHAGQVSRLCVLKSAEIANLKKQPVDKSQLLQAAMTGWLHDPKLNPKWSGDNLATHPLLASAIVHHVFQPDGDKTLVDLCERNINRFGDDFKQGLIEAVSINNDSRYITEQVILKTLKEKTQKRLKFLAPLFNKLFDRIFKQRLEAAAKGEKPKRFSLSSQLLRLFRFGTGLKGIVFVGSNPDNQLILESRVSAYHLLSHHASVSDSGKASALALVNSDPLLLSPHKLLASNSRGSVNEIVSDFVDSFQHNIDDLPKSTRQTALVYQHAVLLSVIDAAEKLTGQQCLVDKTDSFTASPKVLKQEIKTLSAMIKAPETWSDYAVVTPDNKEAYQQVLEFVQQLYLDTSAEFKQEALERIK